MADIKLIVMALVGLSTKEVKDLVQVLKDEYGIAPQSDVLEPIKENFDKVLTNETVKTLAIAEEAHQQAQTKRWFVPKKIGKPCKPLLKKRR